MFREFDAHLYFNQFVLSSFTSETCELLVRNRRSVRDFTQTDTPLIPKLAVGLVAGVSEFIADRSPEETRLFSFRSTVSTRN